MCALVNWLLSRSNPIEYVNMNAKPIYELFWIHLFLCWALYFFFAFRLHREYVIIWNLHGKTTQNMPHVQGNTHRIKNNE